MADDLRDRLQASLGDAYVIERELGGGMSHVFLARETRLGRAVVIKVLNPELAAAVSAERFDRETRLAARLQDPRIVPVLAAGDAGGLPYYTMPYVAGESLRARLGRGRLSVASSVGILRDVALALEYAHAHGIVHRDIKPENILLANNTAVVTDFGIAKAIAAARTGEAAAASQATLTHLGMSLGTPAYMAPEQALGDAGVDHRADIYAWGVVAYELLAGRHPFAGRSGSQAMVAAHVAEMPPPVATRVPGLPPALAALVDRALAKAPGDRPPDAAALLAVLEGTSTTGASWSRPDAVSRRPLVFGGGAALVLAGVVAVVALRAGPDDRTGAGASAVRSIAVLPFSDLGGDSASVYLGNGMAEALTTTLVKLPDLRLINARSVAAPRGRPVDAREAGRSLGVDAVLQGSIQRRSGQLRIQAHLVRVADGQVLWGERYDGQAGDIFALEDDISAAIAGGLRGTLSGGRAALASGVPRGTRDLGAYDLYLRARYAFSRRGERGLRAAVTLFDSALARDPQFARAHAGLAMAYAVLPIFTSAITTDSALTRALRSGERALALDSSLADAHLAMAYALKMRWRWGEAERHFRAASALAPEDPLVHHWFGVHLYAVGDVDGSVAELARARELDPFTATIGVDGAIALYAAGRLDEARSAVRRAVTLDSTLSDAHLVTGLVQLAQGYADSALASFDLTRRLGTGFDTRAFRAVALAALGEHGEAQAAYEAVRRDHALGRARPYDVSIAAVGAGNREAALAAVERIVATRDMLATEVSLPCDPLFDPLKGDSRFAHLLARAGMATCPPGRTR